MKDSLNPGRIAIVVVLVSGVLGTFGNSSPTKHINL